MLLLFRVFLISTVFICLGAGIIVPDHSLKHRIGPDVLLLRLDKLLDVCIANYEDLTTDLLLGVAIANGQLKSILADSALTNRPYISALQKKCDYVESRIESIFFFPSGANAIVSKVLINSNFWKTTFDPDDRSLKCYHERRRRSNERHTLRDYLQVLEIGSPNEVQSDQCLSELLVNESENKLNSTISWNHANHPGSLRLSRSCIAAMSVKVKSYGLLFYTILRRQRFVNVEESFVRAAEDRLCAQILQEAQLIASLRFPEMFRDLFMEQVFLCAFAGYKEFKHQAWINEIVGWQNTNGCFKYYKDFDESETNQLIRLCSTHMSGLGAAILGLFARLQY
ncbi:uncharacterized protein LOC131427777 isoform X2 [Malaya genurostris]|uniref:uncharacterized protein LOC131427777 isoform X2 n=1 Tax=Malaya genurostris TaxID=325434 RepID=UPI0026F3D289|nr:uncharacterized protein LOC131427777 isoform X2 [Malaya genurostris]